MRFQLNHIENLLKKWISIKIYDCTVLSNSLKSRNCQAGNTGFMIGIGGSNKGGFGKNGSRWKPALIRLRTFFLPINTRKGMEAAWNLHTLFGKKMADAQTLFQCGFAPDFVVFSKETVSMIIVYFELSFDNSNTVVLLFLFWYITLV